MNCIAEGVKLEQIIGKVGNAEYTFTNLQSPQILGQNRSCFLALDLQNFIEEKNDDQVEEKDKKQTDSCFIAGVFACRKRGFAHVLKEKYIQTFKENVYTQLGDILLGFQNSLEIFGAQIASNEVKSEMDLIQEEKTWSNLTLITANIILRHNGNIYNSQINYTTKNLIGIKLKNSAIYQQILIDQLKPLSENCYYLYQQELPEDDIDEIILSDISNHFTDLTSKDTSQYPTYMELGRRKRVYFLRITNLKQ